MTIKQRLARSLRNFGYDIVRYRPDRHPTAQLIQLMKTYQTGMVLDIGANSGQYALDIRANGYTGKIVSFEPLSSAFKELSDHAAHDPKWQVGNLAVGSISGKSMINIAGNSTSSSLLNMLPAHEDSAPSSKYINTEEIEVETLDRLIPNLDVTNGTIWLKIDTQGFEEEVLKGASQVLDGIATIQLEMSLLPLYEGAPTFMMLMDWMDKHGYDLVSLQPGFTDAKSGRLLQTDGIFHAKQ